MKYQLLIERSARKSLGKIAQVERGRIVESIRALANNPRPKRARKLSGRDAWRIRVGNYRVIYEIKDEQLIVLVVVIGHRKDIYR